MKLPEWVAEADRKRVAELNKARLSAPSFQHKVADSFHTAPGWRELSFELTCIPNGQYPWNPEVIKAIWKFDPTLVPMWVNWAFAPPGQDNEVVVFGRHVIGRHEPLLCGEAPEFFVSMPSMPCQGLTFKKPNVLELVLMMPRNSQYPEAADLPGDFLAFDWPIVEWLRERFKASQKSGQDMARDYINAKREEEDRNRACREDEMAYRMRDLERYVSRKLDQVSEVEIRDHLLGERKGSSRIYSK